MPYKPLASAHLQYHHVYIWNEQFVKQNYTKIFTQTHHITPFGSVLDILINCFGAPNLNIITIKTSSIKHGN